jgi:hypothetical protein
MPPRSVNSGFEFCNAFSKPVHLVGKPLGQHRACRWLEKRFLFPALFLWLTLAGICEPARPMIVPVLFDHLVGAGKTDYPNRM